MAAIPAFAGATTRVPARVASARHAEEDAPTLWGAAAGGERSLAALIGAGRARVLQALTEPRTTGEVAQLAGISGPGASQHTAVLRKAGLITTRRERNMAWHELTPLGRAMLGDGSQGEAPLTLVQVGHQAQECSAERSVGRLRHVGERMSAGNAPNRVST
ncbi:ArsR/SmtB family transcription factor [Streptomyces koyangensis]|uniref:ArsR/SmtB family transcription factor n=1 Tax=Streptomyces koyangensis TaxID=188770 RepID=UPI003CFF13E9